MNRRIALAALLTLAISPGLEAEGASSTTKSSRSDYTKEQQKKLHAEGLRVCQKKLGDRLANIKVDYKNKQYICYAWSNNRTHPHIEWGNPAFLK